MKIRPTYYEAGPSEEPTKQVLLRVIFLLSLSATTYLFSTHILPEGALHIGFGLVMVISGMIGFIWSLELCNRLILWKETRGYTDE